MKKITWFMSCLFLLFVAMQARAADVYVETSDPTFNVYTWSPESYGGWPGKLLTDEAVGGTLVTVDGKDYYMFSIESKDANGGIRYIIFNKDGQQTANIPLVDGDNYFVYPGGENRDDYTKYESLTPPPVIEVTSYTIAGEEALMGSNWNPADTNNDMTQQDSVYVLTKENLELEARSYEYKAVGNHAWGTWELPQQGNQSLTIGEAGIYNVTFTLTLGDENTLVAQAEKVGEVEPIVISSYTVVGDSALMGEAWNPELVANDMVQQEDDTFKLFKNELELAAGNYEYKVTANHKWSDWELPQQGNQTLAIAETGKYEVTFTLTLGEAPVLSAEAVMQEQPPIEITSYTIVGDSVLMGEAWNPELAANDMALQEDGTYKLVKEPVELTAGNYEYKVTANHAWQVWEEPMQGNQTLAIDEDGNYQVTFILTLGEENVLTANAVRIEEPQPQPDYVLIYGLNEEGAVWQNLTFVAGEGDYEGKLVAANVEFVENTEFKVQHGETYYGGATDDDYYLIHSEWCTNVPMDSQGNNFHINEAGTYTFVLNVSEEGITMDVLGFAVTPQPEPEYLLHYGKQESEWQDKVFVAGEGDYEGKLVAADVHFDAYTEFGVKCGETWYAGLTNNESLYWIHATWCENIPLSTGEGIQNFIIYEEGTYTFIITVADESLTLDVKGFGKFGDLNGDGLVDIADVNIVINMMLGKEPMTPAGDLNGDNMVDIADVNKVINLMLGKRE